MKMTVFFDGSFWCGLIEYVDQEKQYHVFKQTFGKEPNNAEIWHYVLFCLSSALERNEGPTKETIDADVLFEPKWSNPKRMQRELSRKKNQSVVSTKAQLALQMARELKKVQHKHVTHSKKEKLQEQRYQKRQVKKHQKQRGH